MFPIQSMLKGKNIYYGRRKEFIIAIEKFLIVLINIGGLNLTV